MKGLLGVTFIQGVYSAVHNEYHLEHKMTVVPELTLAYFSIPNPLSPF